MVFHSRSPTDATPGSEAGGDSVLAGAEGRRCVRDHGDGPFHHVCGGTNHLLGFLEIPSERSKGKPSFPADGASGGQSGRSQGDAGVVGAKQVPAGWCRGSRAGRYQPGQAAAGSPLSRGQAAPTRC